MLHHCWHICMQMTLGSSKKAAGSGNSGSALLSNSSSSFKDPFAALAQSSEPWQELDVEAGRWRLLQLPLQLLHLPSTVITAPCSNCSPPNAAWTCGLLPACSNGGCSLIFSSHQSSILLEQGLHTAAQRCCHTLQSLH